MVVNVCQGSIKALRNHLQAHHKKEFTNLVKEEEEEEKKSKAPNKGKNEVFPAVAWWAVLHEADFETIGDLFP